MAILSTQQRISQSNSVQRSSGEVNSSALILPTWKLQDSTSSWAAKLEDPDVSQLRENVDFLKNYIKLKNNEQIESRLKMMTEENSSKEQSETVTARSHKRQSHGVSIKEEVIANQAIVNENGLYSKSSVGVGGTTDKITKSGQYLRDSSAT